MVNISSSRKLTKEEHDDVAAVIQSYLEEINSSVGLGWEGDSIGEVLGLKIEVS
jgi:hypothetical protein